MACLSYKPNPITLTSGNRHERFEVLEMQEKLSSKLHTLNEVLSEMLQTPATEKQPNKELSLGGRKQMSKFTTALTKTQIRDAKELLEGGDTGKFKIRILKSVAEPEKSEDETKIIRPVVNNDNVFIYRRPTLAPLKS